VAFPEPIKSVYCLRELQYDGQRQTERHPYLHVPLPSTVCNAA
jgi:hypothetical protein